VGPGASYAMRTRGSSVVRRGRRLVCPCDCCTPGPACMWGPGRCAGGRPRLCRPRQLQHAAQQPTGDVKGLFRDDEVIHVVQEGTLASGSKGVISIDGDYVGVKGHIADGFLRPNRYKFTIIKIHKDGGAGSAQDSVGGGGPEGQEGGSMVGARAATSHGQTYSAGLAWRALGQGAWGFAASHTLLAHAEQPASTYTCMWGAWGDDNATHRHPMPMPPVPKCQECIHSTPWKAPHACTRSCSQRLAANMRVAKKATHEVVNGLPVPVPFTG